MSFLAAGPGVVAQGGFVACVRRRGLRSRPRFSGSSPLFLPPHSGGTATAVPGARPSSRPAATIRSRNDSCTHRPWFFRPVNPALSGVRAGSGRVGWPVRKRDGVRRPFWTWGPRFNPRPGTPPAQGKKVPQFAPPPVPHQPVPCPERQARGHLRPVPAVKGARASPSLATACRPRSGRRRPGDVCSRGCSHPRRQGVLFATVLPPGPAGPGGRCTGPLTPAQAPGRQGCPADPWPSAGGFCSIDVLLWS